MSLKLMWGMVVFIVGILFLKILGILYVILFYWIVGGE